MSIEGRRRAAAIGRLLTLATLALSTTAGAGPLAGETTDGRGEMVEANGVETVIVGMEKAALDRWGKGDPSGFLEISAPEVVYFDPFVAHRLDGLEALTEYYETLRGKIHLDSYRLLNPKVQAYGDVAVLTFNFVSQSGDTTARWNCTEVYRRLGDAWRIVQTHWSLTQPNT